MFVATDHVRLLGRLTSHPRRNRNAVSLVGRVILSAVFALSGAACSGKSKNPLNPSGTPAASSSVPTVQSLTLSGNTAMKVNERAQFTVTTFWEVLASTTRGENITRHLRMKTLHVITEAAHARSRRRSTDTWEHRTDHHGLPEDLTEVGGEDGIECDEILTPETDLYGVLRWARTTHVLSAGDAQLLADVYLTDRRRPDFTRAARRSGLELRTCQRRTAAARERLALAVRQDLAGTREISASAAA